MSRSVGPIELLFYSCPVCGGLDPSPERISGTRKILFDCDCPNGHASYAIVVNKDAEVS